MGNMVSKDKLYETVLSKKKIPELKTLIKEKGIKVKGLSKMKKEEIVLLLQKYYKRYNASIYIQTFIKNHLHAFFLKRCQILRGDSLKHRDNCVNETDFYTFDPLKNIPDEQFYCYLDKKENHYYGFNIFSLYELLPRKGYKKKCLNPYNREEIDEETQTNVSTLVNLMKIVEPDIKDMNKESLMNEEIPICSVLVDNNRFLGNSLYPQTQNLNEDQKVLVDMLIKKRQKPIDVRIEELFYEIDLLGNYTQRKWFDDLERQGLVHFFRHLQDFWLRGGIQMSTKREICPLTGDPFYNIYIQTSHSTENIREACLIVMENLVLTGLDESLRNTGVIYILTSLATVSQNVRNFIDWLQ